jgi:RNase P/RNase MRP subunit POP5
VLQVAKRLLVHEAPRVQCGPRSEWSQRIHRTVGAVLGDLLTSAAGTRLLHSEGVAIVPVASSL